jgi:metal-responsive CopG/Arc/MetJ family transcriptional regulator
MKTAISIDGSLLREADRAARRMGVSRSALFARAIGEFLERQRKEEMLRKLNEVYLDGTDEAEKSVVRAMKTRVRRVIQDGW